ncbi:IclR family transcriptional regulator [Sinorhizobium meliloti]|uniref:IclR family transcriptional regulator n=1 Tax=Rhizobium meliloti TaxID=382 RepID=UPI00238035AB|nr:IclR family transcriptional regulator [Sinorhizobium meliloti]MDE3761442.1 IclR family transcriptional regulator [Sinorhizobium meliloti]
MNKVKSLIDHCFDCIEILIDNPDGMRLSDLCVRLGISKGAAHRLLANLNSLGFVEQDEKSSLYRPTLKLTILGQKLLISTGVPDICQPVLDRLAVESQEFVRLTMVSGERLIFVAQSQGAKGGLMYVPRADVDVPLHVTANGKIWLSTLPKDDAVRIVLNNGFGRPNEFGPNAVRSIEALMARLDETRKQGFGVSDQEAEHGVYAIAAAVGSKEGPVVGTVSVAGPSVRLTERKEQLATMVLAAARELAEVWPARFLGNAPIVITVRPKAIA